MWVSYNQVQKQSEFTHDNLVIGKIYKKLPMRTDSCKEKDQNLHMTESSCKENSAFLHMIQTEIRE